MRLFRICCLALLLVSLCLSAHRASAQTPQEQPPKPPRNGKKGAPKTQARVGRAIHTLDGTWHFLTDPDNKGVKNGWGQNMPASTQEITVPSLWDTKAAPNYKGVAWYWKSFTVPISWMGQTIRLRFAAVSESAQVWLNGVKLGDHVGGATPFEFNVTHDMKIGQVNLVAVRVEGDAKQGAGIWEGVDVASHDEAYLSDAYPTGDAFGRLTVAIRLLNTSKVEGDATLDVRIVTQDTPPHVIKQSVQYLHVTPGENLTSFLVSIGGRDLTLWTPENPRLYAFQMVFRQDKDILDTAEAVFGFRTFGLNGSDITLNGEKLTLTPGAPLLASPLVLGSPDDAQRAREALERVKRTGVNLIYLNAPPAPLLRLADQVGLLVIEGTRPNLTPQAHLDEIRALVQRDRSHACILGWDLGEVDSGVIQTIRQLDTTRFLLTGSASARTLYAPERSDPSPTPLPQGLVSAALKQ